MWIFPNNKSKTFVLLVSTPTSHPLYHCRIATSGQSEPRGKSASKVAMMPLILQWSFVPVTHIHVLSLRCWVYCIHCRLSTLLYPPCNKFLTQHSDFSMSTTTWSESSSLVWSHSCRLGRGHYTKGTTATTPTVCDGTLNFKQYWGNLLRSVPFLMAGHLNIKIFQTLGTPFFNTNPKNGCPKMICQYSGQAPRHFTCRFHYMSCSTDVRPWDSKRKFVFLLQIVPITKTLVPNALK